MTAQHPAAPETETYANGLTEAERAVLVDAVGNRCSHTGKPDYSLPRWCTECDQAVAEDLAPAVKRIVAERVRVVEGERDAARAELRAESRRADKAVERANHYEGQFRVREQEPDQKARAESAEAAHEAEKAAHEGLRAEFSELADDFASNVDWSAGRGNYGDNEAWERAAREVRALLGGGGER